MKSGGVFGHKTTAMSQMGAGTRYEVALRGIGNQLRNCGVEIVIRRRQRNLNSWKLGMRGFDWLHCGLGDGPVTWQSSDQVSAILLAFTCGSALLCMEASWQIPRIHPSEKVMGWFQTAALLHVFQ